MGRRRNKSRASHHGVGLLSALIGLLALPAAALAALGDFTEPPTSPEAVGKTSEWVASGDFDNDADEDLVVANKDGGGVTVLLNDGKGDFAPAGTSPETVNGGPWVVVVGKFNADNNLDLAVGSETEMAPKGRITILLGDGKGDFGIAGGSPITIPGAARRLAVGDLDSDGDQDLAVAEFFPAEVAILLNSGSGSFSQPGSSPEDAGGAATNLFSIAAADFNDDEQIDIVVGSEFSNEVKIYTNNGDENGDFTAGVPVTGVDGVSMTTGFFDGNDIADVAVGDEAGSKAVILLGNGGGGLAAAPSSPETLPGAPHGIASSDFNNDGAADLVAVGGSASSFAAILLGNGEGDFTAPSTSPETVGSFPVGVAAAPLSLDGSIDLAIASIFGEKLNVLFNDFSPGNPTENLPGQNSSPQNPLAQPPLLQSQPTQVAQKKPCPKGKVRKRNACVKKKCAKGKKLKGSRCVKRTKPSARSRRSVSG
jgi:VCBS repeat protein